MKRWFYNKKGAINIIIALSMVVLMGFAAIAIDVGWMLYHKSRLQNATDAAALAGARELLRNEKNKKKVRDELRVDAKNTVKEYMVYNMLGSDGGEYDGSFSYDVMFYGDDNKSDKKIVVSASKNIDYFFARVLGIDSGDVSAKSAAIIAPLKNVPEGLRPFGVEQCKEDEEWSFGDQVILKTDSEEGNIRGNFQALALDGTGGDLYGSCIINGSMTGYDIGDDVVTEPGNIVGKTDESVRKLIDDCISIHNPPCTYDAYVDGCPRVITIPIIDSLVDAHGRDTVKIVGFAVFFIEDVKEVDDIDSNDKYAEVKGRFIRELIIGDADEDEEDLGAIGVKLVWVD